MKRPSFQFYPADWRKDVELQSCSMAAQGLWINAMCVAHECEPYGHLTVNGKGMTSAQLGRQVGLSAKEADALVMELVDAGVAKRTDEGVLYSNRMVRDERLRNVRADAGRLGGNPNLVKQKVNHELNQTDNQSSKQSLTPSSSSSSSTSVNTPKAPKGAVEVPDWIPEKPWADFVAMRRAKGPKTPFTVAAAKGVVEKLSTFRAAGHDVAVILQESTINGWSSVFEPKGRQQQAGCRDDWTSAAT